MYAVRPVFAPFTQLCAKRYCPEGLTEFQVNPALYVVFLAGTYRYENRL